MKGKESLRIANSRNLFGQVGRRGEEISASLLKGDIVTDGTETIPFADVTNSALGLAIEAKMCNGRHAQRPPPKQVVRLFEEVRHPFLYDKGVYVFIFYRGVYGGANNHAAGKSKIMSRRYSRAARRAVICRELQYIYILDVNLVRYLMDQPCYIKKDANVYDPERKPDRGEVLYLNRTFMKGFSERKETHRTLLRKAHGRNRWAIRTVNAKLCFIYQSAELIKRVIPVHVIGCRRTVTATVQALNRPNPMIRLGEDTDSLLRTKPPH